jgi:hypothetical protein
MSKLSDTQQAEVFAINSVRGDGTSTNYKKLIDDAQQQLSTNRPWEEVKEELRKTAQ